MSKTTQPWYSIRSRASTAQGVKAAEIMIYGDIGERWYGDSVLAKDFVKEIAALDAAQITIRINSYGGSVTDGIAIHNAIKRHSATTTVVIDGVAASIASLIAMAGDTVEMAENALLMIHAPWGMSAGNSADMREFADMLDKYAEAMATSYAAKTGHTQAEILALLTDGEDHWYTAAEALDATFVDSIIQAMPLAASFDRAAVAARFKSLPGFSGEVIAAAAAPTSKEIVMTEAEIKAAADKQAAETKNQIDAAASAGVQAEAKRRNDISASFASFQARAGVAELLAACQADTACTALAADKKLLDHLGKTVEPVAGGAAIMGESGRDRFIADAVNSIMARGAARDEKGHVQIRAGNPLKGAKLAELARMCLAQAGIKIDSMDQMKVVGAAFTQSTSDFPVLLENVMHKTLQQAYAVAPDTWSRFCAIGSVSDFRAHNRYRVGSIGNLDSLNELGEFKNKTIPDGEKSSITAGTKGNIINISRQIIVNDDLQALVSLTAMLGRAAKRSIEASVYALLAENSGLGPVLTSDSKTLFHADHGNLVTSGAVPSIDTIEAARILMASQMDVGARDYLDLRPALWLGPMSLGGKARVVNTSVYDPDTANKLQRPNMVNGLFRDVIDSPRLSGNPWYMFADPNEAPVLEVAFLDGVQDPYLELENGFDVDGARYKVRLDYGVAGIDYRGAVQNDGA